MKDVLSRPRSDSSTTRRHLVLVALAAGVAGCAQTGVPGLGGSKKEFSADELEALKQVDFAGSTATNGELSVTITQSVLPGSPDYFPKVESWVEYRFELRTFASPISVQSAVIVSKEGAPVPLATRSAELMETPKLGQQILKSNAIYAGAAAGGMMLGAAIPFIGPMLMAGAHVYNISSLSGDDKVEYEKQFMEKTGLRMPHLETNARIARSAFFPMMPEARAIVIDYKYGVGFPSTGRLEIPLRTAAVARQATQAQASDSGAVQRTASVTAAPDVPAPTSPPQLTKDTIARAQARLNMLGFQVGRADGLLGARTRQAIRQYQQSKGITSTGELDAATLGSLGID